MRAPLRIFIFVLLVLAACQPQPQEAQRPQPTILPLEPQVTPPAQEQVQAPEQPQEQTPPAQIPAEAASAQREAMFGTRKDGSKVITEADVLCDLDERKITFRFRNKDTRTWQLDNDLPMSPPEGVVGIYMTFNQYPVNQNHEYFVNGERQFGPSSKLSENCGGVRELKPEQEVVCTLQPVPLRDRFYFGGVNDLFINVPGAAEDGKVDFTCT